MHRGFLPLAGLSLLLSGCVTAVTALSDLPSAAEAGVGLLRAGKFDSFDKATMPDVVAAARRAGANLGLRIREEKDEWDGAHVIKFVDARGQELAITMRQRTDVLTQSHVDVGLFGPKAMGKLMIGELVAELSTANAYVGESATRPRPRDHVRGHAETGERD